MEWKEGVGEVGFRGIWVCGDGWVDFDLGILEVEGANASGVVGFGRGIMRSGGKGTGWGSAMTRLDAGESHHRPKLVN